MLTQWLTSLLLPPSTTPTTTTTTQASQSSSSSPQPQPSRSEDEAEGTPLRPAPFRHAKQFTLMMAGAGFLAASVFVARRSVLRQRLSMLPPFYASNRAPLNVTDSDRQLLAARALGLATLNVVSFGVLLVGGLSWGFNISSVDELRARTRMALDRPTGMSPEEEREAELEMEKMVEGLMGRFGLTLPGDGSAEGSAEGASEESSEETLEKKEDGQ